jgi:quercetin dioxygenase-like cupin family protein
VVQCLEGRVAFTAFGKAQALEAGKLLYLPTGEPHSVKGIEDASLLLTILLPKH